MADVASIQQDVIGKVNATYFASRVALQAQGVSQTSQQGIDFQKLYTYINDWATRRAAWAARGTRDDGSVYGLDRWIAEGQGYAKDASDRAGMASDDSVFSRALATVRDIPQHLIKDVQAGYTAATSPTKWPWYLQAAVAGVGLFYASQIYRNFRGTK